MNYPFPIFNNQNIIYEINNLKAKINELEQRIIQLENKETKNYLKKDDSYYII